MCADFEHSQWPFTEQFTVARLFFWLDLLARPNRPKWDIEKNKENEMLVLIRTKKPKNGYWPDQTDRNLGIGQTEGAIKISRPLN